MSEKPVTPPDELGMDCSAVLADVWLMLDGECNDATRARLQHHLDTCSSCLEHYGLEERVKRLVQRKCSGERAPETLRARLQIEFSQIQIRTEGD